MQRQDLLETRRIELWPNPNRNVGTSDPNRTDPNVQQLLVGENGGQEFVRADLDGDGNVQPNEIVNVTDSEVPGDGRPDFTVTEPCVAIPVEDLNLTEPVESYPSLLYQKQYLVNNSTRPGVTAAAGA